MTEQRQLVGIGKVKGPQGQLAKQLQKDFDEENLARSRVGKTPEERLRWIVEFAQRDLDRLRKEERTALGYDLRLLIPPGWQITRMVGPMPETALRTLQEKIAGGIRALLAVPGSQVWLLPRARNAYLTVARDLGAKTPRIQLTWEGNEADGIIGGVVDLLLQAGNRLRACAKSDCRKPFVARKRQVFCSAGCGQAVRNQRKQQRRFRKRG